LHIQRFAAGKKAAASGSKAVGGALF